MPPQNRCATFCSRGTRATACAIAMTARAMVELARTIGRDGRRRITVGQSARPLCHKLAKSTFSLPRPVRSEGDTTLRVPRNRALVGPAPASHLQPKREETRAVAAGARAGPGATEEASTRKLRACRGRPGRAQRPACRAGSQAPSSPGPAQPLAWTLPVKGCWRVK